VEENKTGAGKNSTNPELIRVSVRNLLPAKVGRIYLCSSNSLELLSLLRVTMNPQKSSSNLQNVQQPTGPKLILNGHELASDA
jgi:hypothetical protein